MVRPKGDREPGLDVRRGVSRRQVARSGHDRQDPISSRESQRQQAVVAHEGQRALGELAGKRQVVRRGHDCDVGIGKAGDPALERLDPGGRSGERGRLDEVEVRGPGERRLDPAPGRSLRRGQQEIDARSQRDDDIDPLRGVLGQGAHVERVGDRDPFETELFAQDAIHHPAGQRRGHDAAAGERRAGEVTGHDHPGAARDRFPERTQLGDLEVRARAVDDRERVMGIDPDATGAREVLERRDDPRRLDPSGPRSAEPRHRGGSRSRGP